MKTCSRCKQSKSVDEFGKSSKSKDGLQYHCRQCKAELHQINRDTRLPSIKKSKAKRVDAGRRYVWNYLLEHPCECGEQQPRYLEFDHDDPSQKKNDVSSLVVGGYSLDVIKAEINKCTVRCMRCHRDRTIEQGNHWIGRNVLVEL